MKALWKDLAKLGTTNIYSLYETDIYPAANVANRFLNKWFISLLPGDTLTIDLGAEMDVDAVFVAGCNAALFDVRLLSGASVSIYYQTGIVNARQVKPVYMGGVYQARYIEITADVTASGLAPFVNPLTDNGASLKIKGVGVGCACVLPPVLTGFTLPRSMNTRFAESPGGQFTSSQYEPLRLRSWSFAGVSYADLLAFEQGIQALGYKNPSYFDAFEDTDNFDEPMHMVIDDAIDPAIDGTDFKFTLKMKEAR